MLVLDECESILSRGRSSDSDGARANVFNIILQELEKVAKSDKEIYIVCATNWYDTLSGPKHLVSLHFHVSGQIKLIL